MAYLKKHYSLIHAEKVLKEINRIGLEKDLAEKVWAKAYNNGREQGYIIEGLYIDRQIGGKDSKFFKFIRPRIFLAQHRNGDSARVIWEESDSYDDIPSDNAFEMHNRTFDDDKKAATFIVSLLKGWHAEMKATSAVQG